MKLKLPKHDAKEELVAVINSEGELIDPINHKPLDENKHKDLCKLWDKLAERFRNWSASRSGGAYSQVPICVMPSAVQRGDDTGDDIVVADCQIEFSAKDNSFTGGDDHEGLSNGQLVQELNKLFGDHADHKGVKVSYTEEPKHYYVVSVEFTELAAGFKYIDEIASRMKKASDLLKSHEWIG